MSFTSEDNSKVGEKSESQDEQTEKLDATPGRAKRKVSVTTVFHSYSM